ncbi:MAG: NAD(P)/FAD-dependent oxidoreductase [Methylacidiphilales bacterium]|nr:NAD(P)/FAD-dependent oxidoreductase [Candidatus Methylacidiphilales bacterium]
MSVTQTAPSAPVPASEPVAARPINKNNPHVVILGGGFGGLNLAKSLRNAKARVTLIDRQNHHLFQPLLYQVATASLSTVEIAKPLRSILSDQENINVELGDVQAIDLKSRTVIMHHHSVSYDYLVIAMGGVTSYFGHPEWAEWAPGLKSITDALHIRREILYSFEKAELTNDSDKRKKLMTIIIVGGGPTGVELAGACKELGRFVMRHDFRKIDPTEVRVILIEAADRILMHLPRDLSASAQRQLEGIGVEVRLNTMVKDIKQHTVVVSSKDRPDSLETLSAASIVWAAGVGANPITRTLGVEVDRAGRIKVNPDLSIPGFPEAFAIGDIAFILNKNGTPVPGVSPAAIQMGQFVARTIETDLADPQMRPDQREPFKYWDKGTMATIGHSRAVAMIGGVKFSGFLAWLAWLGVHILFLVGFTNKLTVVIRWVWAFFTRRQGARVFTSDEGRGITPMTTTPSTSMVTPPSTD